VTAAAAAEAMRWENGVLVLLDQTKLPTQIEYIRCDSFRRVAEAIKRLEVRGAPAIGIAAAYAMALAAQEAALFAKTKNTKDNDAFWDLLYSAARELKSTRPTAVNLSWAVTKMLTAAETAKAAATPDGLAALLKKIADDLAATDREVNKKIAANGAAIFRNRKMSFLTHCNTGALATAAVGTALGVIVAVGEQGNVVNVFVDETRPLLQGARLTAWELSQLGIPVTLITDNTAGWVMKQGKVDAVIVGADRIAQNGDTANKIGTYSLAVLAMEHKIPFYVAAPVSTFDFSLPSGGSIPIEERAPEEVTVLNGKRIAPCDVRVYNPAFDITPHDLITGIITEEGVLSPPFSAAIAQLKRKSEA